MTEFRAFHRAVAALRPAMFGSVAMMLRYGLDMEDAASGIESAIDRALEEGLRTPDLGGDASTEDATQAVLSHL